MKRHLYLATALLLLVSVVLGACAACSCASPTHRRTGAAHRRTGAAHRRTGAAHRRPGPTTAETAKPAGKPLSWRSTRAPISSTSSISRTPSSTRATQLGADAKKFDAKLDPNLGVSLVNDAISAGAKGIGITVPDQTIGPAIASGQGRRCRPDRD